jgi:hypothetical protein
MRIELLTGTPGTATKNALKLREMNPNWRPHKFGATVNENGSARVALAMELGDQPGTKFSDLTILTGDEDKVREKVAKQAQDHPCWTVIEIAPYFKGDKPQLAVLMVLAA